MPGKALFKMVLLFVLLTFLVETRAHALEAIPLSPNSKVLNIAGLIKYQGHTGRQVQLSTAPGADGLVRRIVVVSNRDQSEGKDIHWAALALTNKSDKRLDRLLVADHNSLLGLSAIQPNLDPYRVVAITPSRGLPPRRLSEWGADVFAISLAPGETVTFVFELRVPRLSSLYLWEQGAYMDRRNNLAFFQGGSVSVAGVLGLLLMIMSFVRWSPIILSAAFFSWAVLICLCAHFGFLERVFGVSLFDGSLYRVFAEGMLSITLLAFFLVFLRLVQRASFWVLFLPCMVYVVVLGILTLQYASIAAIWSRLFFIAVAVSGIIIIPFLACKRCDRAVSLMPLSILFPFWFSGVGWAVKGQWESEFILSLVVGGLLAIVLVITFTVMQHAFLHDSGMIAHETDAGRKALALSGSGDSVWDWAVDRKEVFIGSKMGRVFGGEKGSFSCSIKQWLSKIHLSDRSSVAAMLQAAVYEKGGRLDEEFRVLRADGHCARLRLRARPVVGVNGKIVRCIGTLSDVDGERAAWERLLHDAVYDTLTGLPNKALFLDRTEMAVRSSRLSSADSPIVFVLQMDSFRELDEAERRGVRDSVLLTVVRRVNRYLTPRDTLGYLSAGRFRIALLSETDPRRIVEFAEKVRDTLNDPVVLYGRDINLSASIGISVFNEQKSSGQELLSEAEVAMHYARRAGGEGIEVFKPDMDPIGLERPFMERELRRAMECGAIAVSYHPIVALSDFSVAGFELSMSWDHPRIGRIGLDELIDFIGGSQCIEDLGLFMIGEAMAQLHNWREMASAQERTAFVFVRLPSEHFFQDGFVGELKRFFSHATIPDHSLKIAIPESIVTGNVERMVRILNELQAVGIGLVLDNFGTGHFLFDYLERCQFDLVRVGAPVSCSGVAVHRSLLLEPVVSVVRGFGIEVLADGVEHGDEVQDLREAGGTFAQGEFFGASLNVRQVHESLEISRNPSYNSGYRC